MKTAVLKDALELIEKEVSLLSRTPATIERQSVLIDYHRILRYWQVKDEAEPTSLNFKDCSDLRRKWLQIYQNLSDLGSENLEESSLGGNCNVSKKIVV